MNCSTVISSYVMFVQGMQNELFLLYHHPMYVRYVTLCVTQRAPPKTFDKQMSNLQSKVSWWLSRTDHWRIDWPLVSSVPLIQIEVKEEAILDVKKEVKLLKKELKSVSDPKLQK